jgi:hypothetical protein
MENEQQESTVSAGPASSSKQLLVFGKHDYIVENAVNMLTKNGYQATGFTAVDEVIQHLNTNTLDGIFIGGGVDPHDRLAIKNLVDSQFSHIKMIDHFGGPATILAEVEQAIGK